jgi:nitronate monooxygenase
MRAEAGTAGDPAALSMWAGTGHLRTREATVSELMAEWADQLEHRP